MVKPLFHHRGISSACTVARICLLSGELQPQEHAHAERSIGWLHYGESGSCAFSKNHAGRYWRDGGTERQSDARAHQCSQMVELLDRCPNDRLALEEQDHIFCCIVHIRINGKSSGSRSRRSREFTRLQRMGSRESRLEGMDRVLSTGVPVSPVRFPHNPRIGGL